jgi:peptidoglycan hydrolase CwlO-like protein
MATKAKDNGGLFLATTTAVASILGNVALAIENSKIEKIAQGFRDDRTRLMQALRRWQQSYQSQQVKLRRTQDALQNACEDKDELQRKVKTLDTRITTLSAELDRANAACAVKDRELSRLRERIVKLERDGRKGRQHE